MWQNIPMSTPVNFMPKTSNLEPTLIPGSLSLICLHSRCGDGERERLQESRSMYVYVQGTMNSFREQTC